MRHDGVFCHDVVADGGKLRECGFVFALVQLVMPCAVEDVHLRLLLFLRGAGGCLAFDLGVVCL